ncbi:MAG TPA: LacI family DNA-binding transcriptional regulator [Candidatus Butyricicoccus stercorigallinarum]|nr:LacI family DNA-binding transcriptional regulator [Candidatus Butyricicoccus stercorigallinarum]
MPRKVTINMVAKQAGVSRGTVDRVLNQRPHVKPELRARIIKAMKDLGYVPPHEEQAKALGLTAPAPQPSALGVLLSNEKGHFRSEIMRGIHDVQALLADYSIQVLIEECETNLPGEALERIDHLVEQGACGIALCVIDHIKIAQKIDELYEKNIPVVTFNSDISNCKRLCFIGEDVVSGGRVAGELVSKYVGPDDTLLVATGNPEFNGHRRRLQGFCERIYEKGFSGGKMELIETYNDYSLTYRKVKEVLDRVPEVRAIYMANHSVTGCVDAIYEAGRAGEIFVVSHDLTESSKRLLQKGDIDFIIAQDIYHQGYRPLLVLRNYVHKHIEPADETDRTFIDIICSENLGTFR